MGYSNGARSGSHGVMRVIYHAIIYGIIININGGD